MFLGHGPLAVPEIFHGLDRLKISTAAPFQTRCFCHRQRSFKMPVTNLSTTPNLLNAIVLIKFKMAERMGFEPMWDCSQTVFKTASL